MITISHKRGHRPVQRHLKGYGPIWVLINAPYSTPPVSWVVSPWGTFAQTRTTDEGRYPRVTSAPEPNVLDRVEDHAEHNPAPPRRVRIDVEQPNVVVGATYDIEDVLRSLLNPKGYQPRRGGGGTGTGRTYDNRKAPKLHPRRGHRRTIGGMGLDQDGVRNQDGRTWIPRHLDGGRKDTHDARRTQ